MSPYFVLLMAGVEVRTGLVDIVRIGLIERSV